MIDEEMSWFDESTKISDQQAELQMYPGVQCVYGFLGQSESLQQRITEDIKIMRSLGLDFRKVAERIKEIFVTREEVWNGHPMLKFKYIAGMRCPWNDYLSSDILSLIPEVREIMLVHGDKTEKAIGILYQHEPKRGNVTLPSYSHLVRENCAMILSDLHPHLLCKHRFLQGMSTPYRLHPDRLEEYLGSLK